MRFSIIIGLNLTIFPPLMCGYQVDWKLGSEFLQYGKNAQLVCNGCIGDVPKGWMGGNPYRLLCTDKKSANPDKYEWKPEKDGTAFELMIKNLSVTDLNCNYTCNCGFKRRTKLLTVDDYIFYLPVANVIFKPRTMEKDEFIIDVTIQKVYPLPECKQYLVYESKTIVDNLPISSKTDSDGIFMNLTMNSTVYCEEHKSLINATILCSLKNEVVSVFSEMIDCRKDNDKRSTLIRALIAGILSFIMIITALSLVVFLYFRKISEVTTTMREMGAMSPVLRDNCKEPIKTDVDVDDNSDEYIDILIENAAV